MDLPKHASSSHAVVSEESPAQVDPPLDGSGESHSLILVCEPAPQVTVQSAYGLQSDHTPSTIVLHNKSNSFDLLIFD